MSMKKSLVNTGKKADKKLRNLYRKATGRPIYQQKYQHYLYAVTGRLTQSRKKKILSEIFERNVGYELNWDDPQTFNEKIAWLKLNYQNPLITTCCDKFAVKSYVSEVIGEEHVVPNIAWWTHPEDIDFDALPDKFALKVNWSSGFNIIVKDKSTIDEDAIRAQLADWIKSYKNSYYQMFNWGYKYMSPVIYAEEYISEVGDSSQVFDYKFFCYNGVCKNLFITTDRFTNKTYNWFDRDFNELPFTYGKAGKTKGGVEKPKHFEEMVAFAEKLAKPFPFVRVDFYEVGDRIMVGEMTFYSGGGILAFHPEEWDRKIGELIELPQPVSFDALRTFEQPSPREAYTMEKSLTVAEKQHFCERKGFAQLHYWPNLKNPKTYNEKIIWLALHYTNPLVAQCTDKFGMKEYVREVLGEEYVVPEIGVYTDVNDIDWNALPESFVIKSTAGWGNKQVILVKNKLYYGEDMLRASVAEWLYPWNTYYYQNMCITDEKVVPRILIEEMLVDSENPDLRINDYKLYCSFGKVKYALIVSGRGTDVETRTFVDVDTWEPLPVRRRGENRSSKVARPAGFDEMLSAAEKLSKDFPLLRADFYEVDGRVYVGEMTFHPGMFLKLEPVEWDEKMGDFIDLGKIPADNIRQ